MTNRRSILSLALAFVSAGLPAQDGSEPAPQFTTSTAYSLTAQGGHDGSEWTTTQTAEVGLNGRWGQTLHLEGRLTAGFDGSELTADSLVRQLVLSWNPTPWSAATLGKQRLKWGSARVLSAIDSLEPTYDPLHPNAVLDGVTGFKAELIPNDWLSLSVLALPAPLLKNTKAAVRSDFLWDDTDLSTGLIGQGSQVAVFADASRFFDRFGVYTEVQVTRLRGRDWSGTNAAGNVGLVSSSEGPWTPRVTGGVQIDIPAWLNGTITWLTEYRYDAAGFASDEAADFAAAWDRRALGGFQPPAGLTVGGFSRHYAFVGLSGIPLAEKVRLGGSLLPALDTGFVLGRLTVDGDIDQHLSWQLAYSRFDHVPGTQAEAGDLVFVLVRDQITVTVSAVY